MVPLWPKTQFNAIVLVLVISLLTRDSHFGLCLSYYLAISFSSLYICIYFWKFHLYWVFILSLKYSITLAVSAGTPFYDQFPSSSLYWFSHPWCSFIHDVYILLFFPYETYLFYLVLFPIPSLLDFMDCNLVFLDLKSSFQIKANTYHLLAFSMCLPHSRCFESSSIHLPENIMMSFFFYNWTIIHYVNVLHFIYQFFCWETFRLFLITEYFD